MNKKKPDMPVQKETTPVMPKPVKLEKTTKPPVKEQINVPKSNFPKIDKPQNTVDKSVSISKQPPVVVKSGDTDLRRGVKELRKITLKMGKDPFNGDMYVFSNTRNSIKVLQEKKGGAALLTVKAYNQIEGWPEYQPPGMPGHTVEFNEKEAEKFLKKMGLPKSL